MNTHNPIVPSPTDEAELLERYRRMGEDEKRFIRRLALLARNGVDIKNELAKKGIKS
jgi:hypothetical protein